MKHIDVFVFACLLTLDGRADDGRTGNESAKPGASETDKVRHDGVWKPKGAMLGGLLLPPSGLKKITLKIKGDTYDVTVEGEDEPDKGTFTLDKHATAKKSARWKTTLTSRRLMTIIYPR